MAIIGRLNVRVTAFSKIFMKSYDCFDSISEIIQIDTFVGTMHIIFLKSESHQDAFSTQFLFYPMAQRKTSPVFMQYRRLFIDILYRFLCNFKIRIVNINCIGFTSGVTNCL
jgi:hypothetical protein